MVRRWLLRFGAVGGVIALVVSFALMSTDQAEAAESLATPVAVADILGDTAGDAAVTEGAAAVCTASVVCLGAVSAVAVGAGLYATRNTWMPWVSNLFGGSSNPSSGVSGSSHPVVLTISVSGSVITVYSLNTGSGPANDNYHLNVVCNISGTFVINTPSVGQNNLYTNRTDTFTCAGGGVPVYAWVTSGGSPDIVNFPSWGSPSFSDSQATYSATVTCVKSDGTTVNLSLATPGGYGGVTVPSCAAAGLGTHGTGVTVCAILSGTTCNGPSIGTWQAPSTPSQPSCDPSVTGICYWEVQVDAQPCHVGDARCLDWWTTYSESPSRVTCTWGTYSMPVADCQFLEYAYNPGGATAPVGTGTTTVPVQPDPGAGTGTGTAPDTGGTPATGDQPNPTVPTTGDCFPSGWASFNPIDWVLKPVECALVWAFVPTTGTMTATVSSMKGDLDTTGVGPLLTSAGSLVTSLGGSGGGCQGPGIDFSDGSIDKEVYPWAACTAPMSTIANLVYDFSTVVLVVFGSLALIRALAAGFGFEFSMGRSAGSDGD